MTQLVTEKEQQEAVSALEELISVPSYNGAYQMWQYTSTGSVPGISGNVDLNEIYKQY